MEVSVCVTDADYEAWRQVRIAVVPGERCDTVAEMRTQDSPDRLLLLATDDGVVVGSGLGATYPPRHRRWCLRRSPGTT
jgi:mycothiol synthase